MTHCIFLLTFFFPRTRRRAVYHCVDSCLLLDTSIISRDLIGGLFLLKLCNDDPVVDCSLLALCAGLAAGRPEAG